MNPSQIYNNISEMNIDIQTLYKKISKLEQNNENIFQTLNNEINQRQNLQKHTLTTNEAFSSQLNSLKGSYEHFEEIFNQNLENLKNSMIEKNLNNINNNNFNDYQNCINFEEIFSKINNIQNIMNTEFNHYRNELNSTNSKIDFFEKKLNDIFYNLHSQINYINQELNNIKKDIDFIKSNQKNSTNNIQKFQSDFLTNQKDNNLFKNDIKKIINEVENKIKNYDEIFNNHNNTFEKMKNEFLIQFKEFNSNVNNKLKEFSDNYGANIDIQNKEIDHFEKHIREEYEKFIQHIQSNIEEKNSAIKKLFDYNSEDIEILKNKNETLENLIKKLRSDIFKGINETEEFLEKKYDSILRIINKVN